MLKIISNQISNETATSITKLITVKSNSVNVNFYTVPPGKTFVGNIIYGSTYDPEIYINGVYLEKPVSTGIMPVTFPEGTTLKANSETYFNNFTLIGLES